MHLTSETQLDIIMQTSLAEEKYSKNGVQKNVHVVVKNTGFAIVLALDPPVPEFDFRRLTIEATLLYDSGTEDDKPVDFVRLKPIEFKARPSESGEECSVEMRIKVLTSQLEDMFFLVRFRALDSLTKAIIPHLECYSEPIKVISKPDQLKKNPHKTKKRNVSELVIDSLQRIEEQQTEQFRLLQQLNSKVQRTPSEVTSQLSSQLLEKHMIQPDDFEHAFSTFMASFNALPNEDRPTKIRKLIRTTSAREVDQLTEMIDMFFAEGLQKQLPAPPQQGLDNAFDTRNNHDHSTHVNSFGNCFGNIACQDECPHKRELARIDEFYKDFLSTAYLTETITN